MGMEFTVYISEIFVESEGRYNGEKEMYFSCT
jgi:hypothetical protein